MSKSTINKFSRAEAVKMRPELEKALAKLATKFGITVNVGKMSYSDKELKISLSMEAAVADGEDSLQESNFKKLSELFGVKKGAYNKKFKTPNGLELRLTEVKPRRRKFPFIGVTLDGKQAYKIELSQLPAKFMKKVK